MQRRDLRTVRGIRRGRLHLRAKQTLHAVLHRLLPGVHLARVYPVFARNLGNRPLLTDRRHCHLRLKFRAVLLPDVRHCNPLAQCQIKGRILS